MKTIKILSFILVVISQYSVLIAQNSYIIKYEGNSYVFNISSKTNNYVISYQSKTDSLSSIYKSDDLRAVISQLIKSSNYTFLDSVDQVLINTVSDKLLDEYIYDQKITSLNLKLATLKTDKGAIIALLKLKRTSVDAYFLEKELPVKKRQINSEKDTIKYSGKKGITYESSINNTIKKKRLSIQSVSIAFENGVIKDLLLRAIDSIDNRQCYFSNSEYIPIRDGLDIDRIATKNRHFLTFQYNRVQTLALDLSEVLDYNRQITCTSGTYIPQDTTISIKGIETGTINLYKPSIAESFDVRLFTDAVGYSGKNSNGIVQLEAQINFYLNQGTKFKDLDKIRNENNPYKYRCQSIWFNRISPYLRLSKLEDNENSLNESEISNNKLMLELYKYANLDFGTDLNFYTFRTDSKLYTANLALGLLRTTIGKDSVNVTSIYLHPYFDLKFFESNKIDFNCGIGGYLAWKVSSVNPIIVSETLHNKDIQFFCNHTWINIGESINLHPSGNQQNSVFIRATQYIGVYNNYFTFQIGYSTSISNLLKF
jgi:hypothetical protein